MKTLVFQCIFLLLMAVLSPVSGCKPTTETVLPVLGPFERVNGEKEFHPVRFFELLNQSGDTISPAQLSGKVRVADFFFTNCPTICPQLQAQMMRISEAFVDEDRVVLLSHTIDPKRDTVEKLAHYARNLGIEDASSWHFLTGERDSIYTLADDYFNIAVEDPSVPGGFDHSGRITVVDPQGYIRSIANGIKPQEVDLLIEDIKTLLDEMDTPSIGN